MKLDGATRPKPKADIRAETFAEEVLLYHPLRTTAIRLNETAAAIWQLCDGRRTVGQIVEELTRRYPEAADRLSGDVIDTLLLLGEQDAVELT